MKHTRIAYLFSFTFAVACGSPNESFETDQAPLNDAHQDNAPLAGSTTDGPSDIVAQADVAYGAVMFHERKNSDGTVAIGLSELVPGNYTTTPLTVYLAEGHTTLEAFMAVLPDAEPPASFVSAHAAQAKALGRPSEEIAVGSFDANTPIEKSTTWCRAVATPDTANGCDYTYTNRSSMDDVTSTQSLTTGSTQNAVAPAICNDYSTSKSSSHTVQGRVRMKKDGGSYDSPGWTPPVAPGWAWYWHGLQLTECHILSNGWELCGYAVNATYKLEGKSNTSSSKNTYDLYLARISSESCPETIIR